MTSIPIRPLTIHDWDACWALRLQALRDHPDAFGSDLDETLAAGEQASKARFMPMAESTRDRIFGAFTENGVLVGVAGIMGNDRRKTRHRMDIWGMYVAPSARGIGTGRRLIEACIDHARGVVGALQIHLTVASHNASAIRLYERCGFRRYGTEPRALILPDGREIDEDLMVLLLDTAPPLPS